MDSFYEAPRQPPVPTTIKRIEKAPVVPEVSVVENSFYQPKYFTNFNHTIRPQSNFNNSLIHNNCKKHVRFESPKNLHPSVFNMDKENLPQPLKTVPDLNGKTFKQIYMANVPDRHLDLSVFEPPFHKIGSETRHLQEPIINNDNVFKNDTNTLRSIENTQAETQYKPHFCPETYSNDKCRDLTKQSTNTLRNMENNQYKPHFCSETYTDKCQELAKRSDEPTIKDLFKIIQQQNEQIMLLQRQVNNLKYSIRQPENVADKQQDHPFMKEITNSPTKKGMFSFDVKATSFEVSFRPQHGKLRNQNNFLEPKIQEITECDDSKDNEDISLHLEESLNMKDSYVSTVPSIQINMDEYQSSEEEESDSPGVTFYKDLMDQVNNVLKKMQVQSECQKKSNNVTGQTMRAVKQATLQHLKSIGVNLSPIQEKNEISGQNSLENKNYDSSEVSFAVKQLLMKYLPDDQLTQAINKPKDLGNTKEKKYKPSGNTEFSFAALQYMKKYNIIDGGKRFDNNKKKDNPKILDVTALKLQPKLL